MTEKELYEMKLHDQIIIEADQSKVRRVVGGWIYYSYIRDLEGKLKFIETTFVPEPPAQVIPTVWTEELGNSTQTTMRYYPLSDTKCPYCNQGEEQ